MATEFAQLRDSLKMEPGVSFTFTKKFLAERLGDTVRAEKVIGFLQSPGALPHQLMTGLADIKDMPA